MNREKPWEHFSADAKALLTVSRCLIRGSCLSDSLLLKTMSWSLEMGSRLVSEFRKTTSGYVMQFFSFSRAFLRWTLMFHAFKFWEINGNLWWHRPTWHTLTKTLTWWPRGSVRSLWIEHLVVAENRTYHFPQPHAYTYTTKAYVLYAYKHNYPTSYAPWSHNKGPHS